MNSCVTSSQKVYASFGVMPKLTASSRNTPTARATKAVSLMAGCWKPKNSQRRFWADERSRQGAAVSLQDRQKTRLRLCPHRTSRRNLASLPDQSDRPVGSCCQPCRQPFTEKTDSRHAARHLVESHEMTLTPINNDSALDQFVASGVIPEHWVRSQKASIWPPCWKSVSAS